MAAEVLNILVGSFGLVTVAPFTALVAGGIYRLGSSPVADQRNQFQNPE